MRKYEEFKAIWLGKKCRDGQCVALYREYTEGFHDMPMLERLGADGGARRLFEDYGTSIGPVTRTLFDATQYTGGDERPEPGDVVVFGPSSTNKWGHVGIMDSLSGKNIVILDQNGIAAMKGEAVKVRLSTWSMDRVLGWLSIKKDIANG